MARILLVEDVEDTNQIISDLLSEEGHDVCSCVNATEAMERFKEETFDLIVSDVLMPGGDGFDLIAFLQAQPETTPPLMIITGGGVTLSSAAVSQTVEKDADLVLHKPIKRQALLEAVAELL